MMKGSIIVEALESLWDKIQLEKPELEDVIITTGWSQDAFGHFCSKVWNDNKTLKNEIFVNGEILTDIKRLLDVVLHESVHNLANVRGIKDCNEKNPKYHNKLFKKLAESEFGFTVTRSRSHGYSETNAPWWVIDIYRKELENISNMNCFRILEEVDEETKTPIRQVCECDNDPRYLRLSKKQMELGPIICGICNSKFQNEIEDEE